MLSSLSGNWDLPSVTSSALPPALTLLQLWGSVLPGASPGLLPLLPAGALPGLGDKGTGCLQLGRRSLSCRGCCQTSGSSLRSSPSELLRLELELGLGLGPGPAKQAKRKGLTGKISRREVSRQCSGEGLVGAPSWSHLSGPGLAVLWSLSPRWWQAGMQLEEKACGLARWRLLAGTSPPPCPGWAGSQASPLSPSLSAAQFLSSILLGPLSAAEEQGQAGCGLGTGISLRQFSRPWSGELPSGLPFLGHCPWFPTGLPKSRSPSVLLAEEKPVGVPWGPEGRAGPSLTQPRGARCRRGSLVTSSLCDP